VTVDVVVLGSPGAVWPLARVEAARLARARGGAGLVIAVGPDQLLPRLSELPAHRPARRVRDRARAAFDAPASASGLVAAARVGAAPEHLLARTRGWDVPVVVAVCGPRCAATEPLLEGAGLVLVTGPDDDALTALAVADLLERGIPAQARRPPAGITLVAAWLGLPGGRGDREVPLGHAARSPVGA
jgi:hypothetical protein